MRWLQSSIPQLRLDDRVIMTGNGYWRVHVKVNDYSKRSGNAEQELLKHLGVNPGEKIEVDKLLDGRILVRAAAPQGSIEDFIGCLARRGAPKLTVREINMVAARGWAKSK